MLVSICRGRGPRCLGRTVRDVRTRALRASSFILMYSNPLGSTLSGIVTAGRRRVKAALGIIHFTGGNKLNGTLGRKVGRYGGRLITQVSDSSVTCPGHYRGRVTVFGARPRIDVYSNVIRRFAASPDAISTEHIPPRAGTRVIRFTGGHGPFGRPYVVCGGSTIRTINSCRSFCLLRSCCL